MNRLMNRANKRLSFGNATIMLIVVTLIGQLLGFFRYRLISTNFTVVNPGNTDSFFAAFQIPDFFYLTIAAGVLSVAFVPVLSDRLQRGDKDSIWDITSSLLNLLTIIMFVVAVFILIFARTLLHRIVAPNLSPQQLNDATTIMRIVALNPLLFTLSGILTSVQQTYGRFFFFAVAPLFYNLSIIASVYIFKYHLGVVGLGLGALIGALAQFLVASLGMWGLNFKWRPHINFKSKGLRQVTKALPPRAIDQGIDSINSIVETNRAASLGKGPVSYYNFATTLMNVPVMLFGTAIATAAFPRLADKLSRGRPDQFHKEFFKVLHLMVWIAMPVAIICFFARGYLARLLFGGVSAEVSEIFGYLSLAIFCRIIYSIISRYFYAQKDTKTPLFVSLIAIGLNIFLVFNLARPRPGSYGISGLAYAQSITAAVEILLLFTIMFVRDRELLNRAFWGSIAKIVSVTGFSLATAFIMVSFLPLERADRGFVVLGMKLGAIAGTTMLMHLGMSSLFGLEESRVVMRKVYTIVWRPLPLLSKKTQ